MQELTSSTIPTFPTFPTFPTLHHNIQTNLFSLDCILSPNSLTLSLKSYSDWMLYEKQYTGDDIGGVICRKMDLRDLWEGVTGKGVSGDMVVYQYGQIVGEPDVPYYKIQKPASITIYLATTTKPTLQSHLQSSTLHLPQIRPLHTPQILYHRSLPHLPNFFTNLTQHINTSSQENLRLKQKIKQLEEKRLRLGNQLKVAKEEIVGKGRRTGEEEERALRGIQEAIRESCLGIGVELFQRVVDVLEHVDVRLEDIIKLSIPQSEARKLKYPIRVSIPETSTPFFIKKSLISSLIYPVQLCLQTADIGYVQCYQNIPIQQLLSSELQNPDSISTLSFLTQQYSSSSTKTKSHKFFQILQQYKQSIQHQVYKVYYLPRKDQDVEACFKGERRVYDFGAAPDQFMDRLCEIRREVGGMRRLRGLRLVGGSRLGKSD